MNDDAVTDFLAGMTPWEKRVVALCSDRLSYGYELLAEKSGLSGGAVEYACERLKAHGFATIKHTRAYNGQFQGSAIFLTERGKRLRQAVI